MSLKTSKKVETNVYELEINVDAAAWADANDKAYEKVKKSIQVPGFRKGKATKGMIIKYYGEEVFYNDAFELLYPETVEAAVNEADLELVDSPYDIDFKEVGKDGVTFTVKCVVKPEIELGKYKGIKVTKAATEVTATEVDAEINMLRERNARLVEVDRKVKDGDLTVIDFTGSVDGVEFQGGHAEEYELEIGSGSFIPGFEDQIIGHKAGDEFDIDVKFPEEYGSEELAGKDAKFAIKLHTVKEKEFPELDDEFAKDVSEFDTLKELKADTKKNLENRKNEQADQELEQALADELAKLVSGEIPQVMFDRAIDDSIQQFGYQIQQAGMDLDLYMQYTGTTEEALREQFKDRAETQVKCTLALEKIAELEKIEVSDADVDARIDEMAKMYEVEPDMIKNAFGVEEIRADLKKAKALDAVKAAAKITEDKPAAKKAPAKKAADKADDKAEKKPAAKKTAEKKPAEKKAPAKKAPAKKADK